MIDSENDPHLFWHAPFAKNIIISSQNGNAELKKYYHIQENISFHSSFNYF